MPPGAREQFRGQRNDDGAGHCSKRIGTDVLPIRRARRHEHLMNLVGDTVERGQNGRSKDPHRRHTRAAPASKGTDQRSAEGAVDEEMRGFVGNVTGAPGSDRLDA